MKVKLTVHGDIVEIEPIDNVSDSDDFDEVPDEIATEYFEARRRWHEAGEALDDWFWIRPR